MRATEFLVVASIITARICRSEIVLPSSRPDKLSANLVKDLVEIVTTCYEDRPGTLGLAGNLPEAVSRILSTEHSIPVVWISNTENYGIGSSLRAIDKFRHKIHHFIIQVSIVDEFLDLIVLNTQTSIWWNHMASFTLVDRSPRCHKGLDLLQIAWAWGMINAKVLCYGTEVSRFIVNYNPFTSQAPFPWLFYSVVPTRWYSDHPFTLFIHDYQSSKAICVNLDFEKTKDLGGLEIRADTLDKVIVEYNDPARFRILEASKRLLSLIYRTLNAKLEYGSIMVAEHKYFDIERYPSVTFDLTSSFLKTYPHESSGIVIMNQFRGYNTRINDIFHALDTYVWIGVGIVYLITFIFFKFHIRQAILPSLFNILRMTCNAGIMNIPDDIPSRIYLSCLFFLWTIIQGFFLCDLASLLTTQFPLPNVDTLKDAETLGYKLCVTQYENYATLFEGRFINATINDCLRYSRNASSVAYLTNSLDTSLYVARKFKLHVSKKPILSFYMGFGIRDNWPLEERVNRVIATLLEADAVYPWEFKYKGLKLSDFEHDDEHKFVENYKPLQLDELAFAFEFLGLGLACATVCFIFELAIPSMTRYNCIRKCIAALRRFDPINYCYDITRKIKINYFS